MKKTVTVNLGGIVFHIDEDAYDALSKYLSAIKSFFNNSQGKDEIMADIENRIAEMFSQKMPNRQQVITIAEVNAVITVMGKPEDFAGESSSETTNGETSSQQGTSQSGRKRGRVFRDPDNKIVGGVCSGISAYFGLDPVWMRIAFACAMIFFGSGFLLYVILWGVIPEAKTAADKLEMKGEDVNYSNIGRTVNEELENLKKKVEDFGKEASNLGSPENKRRAKDFAGKLESFLKTVFGGLANAFVKFLGFILVVVGVVLVTAIIASLFGKTNIVNFYENGENVSYSIHDIFQLFVADETHSSWIYISLALLIGIPIIAAIYGGVKLIFGIRSSNKVFGILSGTLWFAGIIIFIYMVFLLTDDFSSDAKKSDKFILPQQPAQTLYVKTTGEYKRGKHIHNSNFFWGIKRTNDSAVLYSKPKLDIQKSLTDSFEIEIIKESHGATVKEAFALANKIKYGFEQTDSTLILESMFIHNKNDRWRNQKINIVLKVPESKMIRLDANTKELLYDVENITNTLDKDMSNHTWQMTNKGLSCIDCN